ncbi:hypothetical protein [Spirosoma terrae]|uniref:Uncharacterized protein n=1 Tax=Spirosoma terrae TaxID=1968276 RepID=A0A6L9L9E4_9BACT|nr:hypothetical protein [Spirosoma terrae]NDU95751.1 hypothetical protein [Spirosoma terrae]
MVTTFLKKYKAYLKLRLLILAKRAITPGTTVAYKLDAQIDSILEEIL